MQEKEIQDQDHPDICWKDIPIQYDNYSQEISDKYSGDVFGVLSLFESPHFLWRRFHKNMCKAMVISKLKNYSLTENEEDDYINEIREHENVSFSVNVLSRHQSLVLMVSAFEAYLKDCFIEVLKLSPDKCINQKAESVARKYNFQNVKGINDAFSWLFENDIRIASMEIETAFAKRHKIIHESFYDASFSESELDQHYVNFILEADNLHNYLEDHRYYFKIKHINE